MTSRLLRTACLTLLATPTALCAQDFSAGAILVHLAKAEANPLVGYELSFRAGLQGPFAVWQDASASSRTSRAVCVPTVPGGAGCFTEEGRVWQRIRNLSLGYAQAVVARASFNASLTPHIGWSYIESRSTSPGAEVSNQSSAGGLRAGIGIEMGRPILGPAARLFVAGDVASSLGAADACMVGDAGGSTDCPGWSESRLTSTLRAGVAVRLP